MRNRRYTFSTRKETRNRYVLDRLRWARGRKGRVSERRRVIIVGFVILFYIVSVVGWFVNGLVDCLVGRYNTTLPVGLLSFYFPSYVPASRQVKACKCSIIITFFPTFYIHKLCIICMVVVVPKKGLGSFQIGGGEGQNKRHGHGMQIDPPQNEFICEW